MRTYVAESRRSPTNTTASPGGGPPVDRTCAFTSVLSSARMAAAVALPLGRCLFGLWRTEGRLELGEHHGSKTVNRAPNDTLVAQQQQQRWTPRITLLRREGKGREECAGKKNKEHNTKPLFPLTFHTHAHTHKQIHTVDDLGRMCFVHSARSTAACSAAAATATAAGASQGRPSRLASATFAPMSVVSRCRRESSSPVGGTDRSPGGGSTVRNGPRNDVEGAGSGDNLAQPEYEPFEFQKVAGRGSGHGGQDVNLRLRGL